MPVEDTFVMTGPAGVILRYSIVGDGSGSFHERMPRTSDGPDLEVLTLHCLGILQVSQGLGLEQVPELVGTTRRRVSRNLSFSSCFGRLLLRFVLHPVTKAGQKFVGSSSRNRYRKKLQGFRQVGVPNHPWKLFLRRLMFVSSNLGRKVNEPKLPTLLGMIEVLVTLAQTVQVGPVG